MYHCSAHNWVHLTEPCPICFPQSVVSASTRQPIPLYHDNNDFLRPMYSQKEVQELCTKAMVSVERVIRMINEERDYNRDKALFELSDIHSTIGNIFNKNSF